MGRERSNQRSLVTLQSQIRQTRVLLIGAGGIGCELLKNLVLTGFMEVHIVDLDTIDLSNLNRQFLFRHEHIKKPKALVAKDAASKFNPNVHLKAYHANIKEAQFNVGWFKEFHIVFNALDNLDARRHVNKMCLAANVPLIESGTTGFNGQVQVIKRGITECYDCNTKEVPKSFPICTIRSTPSQPIHCIVWAKNYLFAEVFGVGEDEGVEMDDSADSDNAKEIGKLREEAQALKRIRRSIGSDDFARLLFDKVFKEDIERLRSMDDMWKSRTPPTVLTFEAMEESFLRERDSLHQQAQTIWSLTESFAMFLDSLKRLSLRVVRASSDSSSEVVIPRIEFDKDDEDTLDFVVATANIRSYIFGIDVKSKFDIKQMAGNIIPAIATANAMTAGLCVLQAFKVLRGDIHHAKMVFLERSSARVLNAEPLRPPNPECTVCGVSQSNLIIDINRATLNDLVKDILKLQLGYGAEITVNSEIGILYDPDLEDNLTKKLSDLGIKADTFLTVVDDDDEDPRVNLSLSISEQTLPRESKPIMLPGEVEIMRKSRMLNNSSTMNGTKNGVTLPVDSSHNKRKRSLEDQSAEAQNTKRGKVFTRVPEDELVLIEDGNDGAIVIEDD